MDSVFFLLRFLQMSPTPSKKKVITSSFPLLMETGNMAAPVRHTYSRFYFNDRGAIGVDDIESI